MYWKEEKAVTDAPSFGAARAVLYLKRKDPPAPRYTVQKSKSQNKGTNKAKKAQLVKV